MNLPEALHLLPSVIRMNIQAGDPVLSLDVLGQLLGQPNREGRLSSWLAGRPLLTVQAELNSDHPARSELQALELLLHRMAARPLRWQETPETTTPVTRVLLAVSWLLESRHHTGTEGGRRPPTNLRASEVPLVRQLARPALWGADPRPLDEADLMWLPQAWPLPLPDPPVRNRAAWHRAICWAAEVAARDPQAGREMAHAWNWPAWLMGHPIDEIVEAQPWTPCPDGWSAQAHADASRVAHTLGALWSRRPGSPGSDLAWLRTPAALADDHLSGEPWRYDPHGPWHGHGLTPEWRLLCRLPVGGSATWAWLGPLTHDVNHLSLQLITRRQGREWLRATRARPPGPDDPVWQIPRPERIEADWDTEVLRRTLSEHPLPRLPGLAISALILRRTQGQTSPLALAARHAARTVQTGSPISQVSS